MPTGHVVSLQSAKPFASVSSEVKACSAMSRPAGQRREGRTFINPRVCRADSIITEADHRHRQTDAQTDSRLPEEEEAHKKVLCDPITRRMLPQNKTGFLSWLNLSPYHAAASEIGKIELQ